MRGSGLNIKPHRFLTAFGSSWNSFLGFYMEEPINQRNNTSNKPQTLIRQPRGIMWGKDSRHFEGKVDILKSVANFVPLVATSTMPVFQHKNVQWLGHQTPQSWRELLTRSKFLLGLGDPLLGPSAIEAIASGCMYINPIYPIPVRDGAFNSQHPYADAKIGKPYVCSYRINDLDSLKLCVDLALTVDLEPFLPPDFTKVIYLERVRQIFNL